MKIDKVILSTTNNSTYYDFWNPLSKVFKEKFGIEPVLIWLGTEEDFNNTELNQDYGKVYFLNPNKDYPVSVQSVWALYWFTKFFQNDVCFIQGIDEVPLSKMFLFDMISEFSDDDYVMLIANAYSPGHHWSIENSASPSSQHCAKGSTFNKIYKFEEDFNDEVKKVFESGVKPFWFEETSWGLDESYFSLRLREYENKSIIKSLNEFGLMASRRIDCDRHIEIEYDLDKLNQGWYSQGHLCRPFSNHREWLSKLYNDIPKFV